MAHIDTLIQDIYDEIPFQSETHVSQFLSHYPDDDQAAFISALYIGRSHIHDNSLNHDYQRYLSNYPINRFTETGEPPEFQFISKDDFASIIFGKKSCLTEYFGSFLRCVPQNLRDNF